MQVGQRRVPTSFWQFSDEQSFFPPVSTAVVESPFAAISLFWSGRSVDTTEEKVRMGEWRRNANYRKGGGDRE